jgi:hypothetical protein
MRVLSGLALDCAKHDKASPRAVGYGPRAGPTDAKSLGHQNQPPDGTRPLRRR